MSLVKSDNCQDMQNRTSTIKSIFLLYMPLMYIAIGLMLGVFGNGLPFKDWIRLLVSIIGVFMLIKNYTLIKKNRVFRSLILLMILIILPTFIYYFISNPARAESVRNLGDSILWISVMVLAYLVGYKNSDTLYNSRIIALTIPIYFVVFKSVKAFFVLNTDDTALISTAYYALFLVPFAFMIKRKWLMWFLLCIVFLTVVLSSKRAGFISFIGALIVYAYLTIKIDNKGGGNRLKYFLAFVLIGIVGLQLFNSFISTNNIHLLDRLATMQEDGGSGRDEVYAYTWGLLMDSDLLSLLFGHGFNTVVHYSLLELSAHTDFLETPFDYGIVGMIVYIIFYFRLFKYYKILKWYNPSYAPIFLSTLFITLVLSTFAHLIIYPTHYLFFCMYWGFLMGECDRAIKDNHLV